MYNKTGIGFPWSLWVPSKSGYAMKEAQFHPRYPGFSPLDVRGSISYQRGLAPLLLLWSMGSQLPAQLIRQNGAQSIPKLKSCLKVIPHASAHPALPARPSSSPDAAKRLTEAVPTHSLRCHFNHKLVGTDSYRTHHLAITAYSPACFPFCTPHDNCCLSS